MERPGLSVGNPFTELIYVAVGTILAVTLLLSGCAAAPSMPEIATEPDPVPEPTPLEFPPGAPAMVSGRIMNLTQEDYFEFTLDAEFGSTIVMTTGSTDTAGQVKTADGAPVTEYCDREDPQPPCIFLYHSDTTGTHSARNRAQANTGAESSANFRWIGHLAPGTYLVQVTAERLARGESGSYELTVEPMAATPEPHPEPAFEPTLLVIRSDAGEGSDFISEGRIEGPDDIDYFKLVLNQSFNDVVVMTAGDTDTSGQVETGQRMRITTECEGDKAWNSVPPCVWGYDDDITPPDSDRTDEFNSMQVSLNFLWEGSLDVGTHYIRVAGANGATGGYQFLLEMNNTSCPKYNKTDPVCVD